MPVSEQLFYQQLYEEHLEDGACLYESLEFWRQDPECNWTDCAELEQRLEAHVDALVIGADSAHQLLMTKIHEAGPGELFVATSVLCRLEAIGDVSRIWEMLVGPPKLPNDASKGEEEEPADEELIAKIQAVAYALRLDYPESMRSKLPKLLEGPHGKLLPIIASTVDETGLVSAKAANNLLSRSPTWFLPEASRLLGNTADPQAISLLEPLLDHKDPLVQNEAALALLKLGHFDIISRLLKQPELFAIPLAFSGDTTAVRSLLSLAKSDSPPTEVLYALGYSGQLAAVKPLVMAMGEESLAVAAAEACQLILGANLYDDQFIKEQFSEEELFEEELAAFKEGKMPPHPSGQAYGENVHTLVNDPDRWRQWLREHRQRFDTEQCYRLGEPFSATAVCRSLYRPGVCYQLRRYIHDEMVIRFKLNLPFTTNEPVHKQWERIQQIAQWVQQNME